MDNFNVPINIYIDLSKAFDSLNHSILLNKLSHYGISGCSNEFLCSYLSDRSQFVDFNGHNNNMLPNVISNLYIKNNEIHSHFTRNSNLLRIPKGTPNFTTISARVWNEIVTKIIMDQHVSISKFKTMLKSYLLVSSFTLTYTK